MRRGLIVRLVAVALVAAAVAWAVAYFIDWYPVSAAEQADRIDFVFLFVTIICIGIFALVASVIVYAVFQFRAKPDDDSDGPPVHGHTGLEIVWTAVPAVLVTAIAVVSAVVLAKNDRLPKRHIVVEVTAQQFAWKFKYPGFGGLESGTLRLPKGEAVELKLKALDVIHSFWVPEFRQKQDAVPGLTTRVVITPTRIGTYPVICTELCGLGHALMRSRAIVMKPDAFEAWGRGQKPTGGSGGGAGKAAFEKGGCGACHTFKPAGSTGTTGPDLDKLATYARRAGKPLESFVRESIVNPSAYVEKGFPNVMPTGFDRTFSKSELDALVRFLVAGSKQ
ncbi:MAG: cytochrome c oxidase subunit II [Actinomycetota bacterium]|nr:cytochrome c oxidase subunit II [Actinomycetota bacterium]